MVAWFGQTPWFSLAHLCSAMEEKRLFESVIVNYWIEVFMLKSKSVLRTNIELWWTMKPGFLTDSFLVEFFNQVNNKKKKDGEEKFMLVFWSLWNFDVYSSKFIMLISRLSFKLQISGPFGSQIHNPKCVWNSKFNYSIQLSLEVFMYYGCIIELKLDMYWFHVHHPCGLESILVSLKW